MLVSEFDYHLPDELIAQSPVADRSSSRMLHLLRLSGDFHDDHFQHFPDLLRPSDLVVFNNTRVIPARLFGRRGGLHSQPVSPNNPASRDFLHGRVELLLTKQISSDPQVWEGLVRPGRKIGVGEHLYFGPNDELQAEVLSRGDFGERTVRFAPNADFYGLLAQIGHVPLPPYIDRPDTDFDREHYQTVYARELGSVAAPTAGLHFTPEILNRIRARGIETAEVTLHVGLGTFQPIRVERVEDVHLHTEPYSISADAAEKISRAKREGRRVVAIGTTTVRTLEFAAHRNASPELQPQSAEADIFISPGFPFRVVDALLTNFHLPKSSLLMLVAAFAGREPILRAYEHAVARRYRFYSYGDCMFIE